MFRIGKFIDKMISGCPGLRGGNGGLLCRGCRISFGGDENVLGLSNDDGCPA